MTPGKIMYCAIPTRLRHLSEQIKKMVREYGFTPVVPFDLGPYEDFEGNPRIGRERTLELMLHLMYACDIVGIFGISEGVLGELKGALDIGTEVRVFHGLDPLWEEKYEEYKGRYSDLLARLRGENHLIALVGPRAIGKTFWSDRLLDQFHPGLVRVRNTTTRPPRDNNDHNSYRFVSTKEFREGIVAREFLEWDEYASQLYGSSFEEIRKVLDHTSGIFAITPNGAIALNNHRLEFNLKIILMIPDSEKVLRENFERRKITDPVEQDRLLIDARNFALPSNVEHEKVVITGDIARDHKALINIVSPLMPT